MDVLIAAALEWERNGREVVGMGERWSDESLESIGRISRDAFIC